MVRSACYLFILVLFSSSGCQFKTHDPGPVPGEGQTIVRLEGEDPGHGDRRRAWIESMHRAAPGVDWKELEYANRMAIHKSRSNQDGAARGGLEVLAQGQLTGYWFERGSVNQAGSVIATEFDQQTEDIWLVSAGGTLFRGNLDGKKWTVVNQDLVFDGNFLRFVPHGGSRRLLGVIDRVLHYSDDEGLSWERAEGLDTYDQWGGRKHLIMADDPERTLFYLVQEWLPVPWKADVGIYMSKDHGETFVKTHSFGLGDLDDVSLTMASGSGRVLVCQKISSNKTRILELDLETGIPDLLNESFLFGNGTVEANLAAHEADGQLRLLTYNSANQLFRSDDSGKSWSLLSTLEERPWGVGLFISPSNPELVLMGAVHCHRSIDGGKTFVRFNDWWEYYGNMDGKLHADMMFFKEFSRKDGKPFILISNHGGLNVTFDGGTVKNLGLNGLNVSQYYDVVTDPIDELFIYAGSQDQGFQRASDFWENDILPFDQAISGDYGHMAFTGNGQNLWMVYPGGWVSFWNSPSGGGLTSSWELKSEHESVWIPPLVADPDPSKNRVYMAGGNANGGAGSFILELEEVGGQITSKNLPFDFRAFSGGEVSALAFSPTDPQRMYAATTNGYFFTSSDKGLTWNTSVTAVPGGQYLYGAAIEPSRLYPDRVFFAGSGYSNPPVFISNDGGQTFASYNDGLPPTLVLDLALNAEETMLFAGTESGPYVCILSEGKWYPMLGSSAPVQRYWSVEYLPLQNRVRFGTYGRGIWDFAIEEEIASTTGPEDISQTVIKVWPNPISQGTVQLSIMPEQISPGELKVYDGRGKLVYRRSILSRDEVELPGHLTNGIYLFQVDFTGSTTSTKVLLAR